MKDVHTFFTTENKTLKFCEVNLVLRSFICWNLAKRRTLTSVWMYRPTVPTKLWPAKYPYRVLDCKVFRKGHFLRTSTSRLAVPVTLLLNLFCSIVRGESKSFRGGVQHLREPFTMRYTVLSWSWSEIYETSLLAAPGCEWYIQGAIILVCRLLHRKQ